MPQAMAVHQRANSTSPALAEARNREIARLNGIYLDMLAKAGVQRARTARHGAAHEQGGGFLVEVDGKELGRARAGGGRRPAEPARDRRHRARHDLRPGAGGGLSLPEQLAVVGAGYIGIEVR
ncbi:MAG: hypothetical protein U1E17_18095 [Geminicoccaceae bacterium]